MKAKRIKLAEDYKVEICYLTLQQIKQIDRKDPYSAAAVEKQEAGWYFREFDGRYKLAPVGPFKSEDEALKDAKSWGDY